MTASAFALVLSHCGGSAEPPGPENALGGSSGSSGLAADAGPGAAGASGATGDTGGAGGAPANLMPDASFEAGLAGWVSMGNASLEVVTDVCHTGTSCVRSFNRTQSWEGPGRRIDSMLTPGARYEVSAWLRGDGDGAQTLSLLSKLVCEGDSTGGTYSPLTMGIVQNDWTKLTGELDAPTCASAELMVFFEGALPDREFFVDDVALLRAE